MKFRAFDSNGDPLAGGKLYSYAAGTTTPQTTYTNAGGTTNANPVVLDANGEADVWMDPALAYKFILKNSLDVTQWTVDNIPGSQNISQYGGTVGGTANALTLSPSTAITSYSTGLRFWFVATATNTTASTVAVSGLSAKDIKTLSGAALTAGNITSGRVYTITYDGTRFVLSEMGTVEDGAITADKLGTGAVSTVKMLDANVTPVKQSSSGISMPTNFSIACSVGSSAMTISLKDAAGSDASATSPVRIPFRHATLTTGTPVVVDVSAALSTVISGGSTLGHADAVEHYIYVYAINNAGTVEIAYSSVPWDEGTVQSTTAEGGAGAADSSAVLYSTTARTNVAIRLLARLKSTQTTAGTWAAVPTEIALAPLPVLKKVAALYTSTSGAGSDTSTAIVYATKVVDNANGMSAAGVYTCKKAGVYKVDGSGYVAGDWYLRLYKGGAHTHTGIPGNANASSFIHASVKLAVGDTVELRADRSVTMANSATNSYFHIVEVGEV